MSFESTDQNDPDQNNRDRNVPDPNDRDRNVPDPNDRDQNDLDPGFISVRGTAMVVMQFTECVDFVFTGVSFWLFCELCWRPGKFIPYAFLFHMWTVKRSVFKLGICKREGILWV